MLRRIYSFLAVVSFSLTVYAGIAPSAMRASSAMFSAKPVIQKTSAVPVGDEQTKAFSSFRAREGNMRASFNTETSVPYLISGKSAVKYAGNGREAALKFINANKDFLGVDPSQLSLLKSFDAGKARHTFFNQVHKGIPVENSSVKISTNSNGQVVLYQSSFKPNIDVSLSPSIPAQTAINSVAPNSSAKAELFLLHSDKDGKMHLVWRFDADTADGAGRYYVDAGTGELVLKISRVFYATSGRVQGNVFDGDNLYPNSAFSNYEVRDIARQYVWVRDYNTRVTTDEYGAFSSSVDGKIFATLRGPNFFMVNHLGASARYDNGGGNWIGTVSHTISTDHPYLSNTSFSGTLTPDLSSFDYVMALVPHFASNFSVGYMDLNGIVTDSDKASVYIGSAPVAFYRGRRTVGFDGPYIQTSGYSAKLQSNESGNYYGFDIDYTKVFGLTDDPETPVVPSDFTWDTDNSSLGTLEEVNAFYHLNAMRNFFATNINLTGGATADFGFHIPVMAAAHGSPDDSTTGMWNAFYDPDGKYIMLGRGDYINGNYRSFAYDAPIVRHEYIHAVVDGRIYPLWYFGESGAISETLSDYWALTSIRHDDVNYTPYVTVMGEYVANGDTSVSRQLRCSGASCKTYPNDWVSEVHDDSRILSQALWELRDPYFSSTWLGNSTGNPRADIFVWNAMFYFPDTFEGFREAVIAACRQIEGEDVCNAGYYQKIVDAFANHGIGETVPQDDYEPNNGIATAYDITALKSFSATISPAYDTDFYSVALSSGTFRAVMTLPSSGYRDLYLPYSLYLFDMQSNVLADVSASLTSGSLCYTADSAVTLEYSITEPGRYILMASADTRMYGSSCSLASSTPYSVFISGDMDGVVSADISSRSYDNDVIDFAVPITQYGSSSAPLDVETYSRTVLLDKLKKPMSEADTSIGGGYLQDVSSSITDGVLSGSVRIVPGFAERYPAAGSVYLEVFGTTPMGAEVSLGYSDILNLTASGTSVQVWNNILNLSRGDKATVAYSFQTGGHLSIKLFAMNGTFVKELFSGEVSAGQEGSFIWDGTISGGKKAASGIYFLKIQGPGLDKLMKISVVK